ncbi:hypothetical protein C4577_05290 [Candidatus Parcubacteria bacterium]|nr:MAG: hypothetical protein C4577_05290 [Candidatus Parcubacteria bacterium]
MSIARLEDVKKVPTFDLEKKDNGFLVELFKDGDKTVAYLTCATPGAFKGYHLHRVRAARYVCIKGRMKIILYKDDVREEYLLDADKPQRLFIPNNIPTGLLNIGDEDAWLINYPDPPYDPSLKDEQVDFTEEELESGLAKI